MNWIVVLNQIMSKEMNKDLVQYFVDNPKEINPLLQHIEEGNGKSSDRASWVLTHIWDDYPYLIEQHLPYLIKLLEYGATEPTQRNIIRILQDSELPEDQHGFLVEYCFQKIIDPKNAIALRVFSIPVLYRLSIIYPDLQAEFKLCLEELIPQASSGLKNRAKKYLKLI